MIQSADIGIGIVGKEGIQAALASDFMSETDFCHTCHYFIKKFPLSLLLRKWIFFI